MRDTRTATMMMGEILELAEHWVVAGLPTLVPPRVDNERLHKRLEEMLDAARAELLETIRRDMPVAVLATDGGPTVAYAMRVTAYLDKLLDELQVPR